MSPQVLKRFLASRVLSRAAFEQGDTDYFWFGDSYEDECPESEGRRSVTCMNPAPEYKSIITRMRMSHDNDTDGLEQIMWVHYAVENEEGVHYTLLVWDVGLFQPHGMWVNKAGSSLHDSTGQAVFPYRGLMNPFPRKNPFVFALYKQTQDLDAEEVFQEIQMMLKMDGHVKLNSLVDRFNLTGPVGMSIIRIKNDAYSVEHARRMGVINHCPYLQTNAAQSTANNNVFNMTGLSFTVSVDITYRTPDITFESCCHRTMIPKNVLNVDPMGVPTGIHPVYTRLPPQVNLVPTDLEDMFYFAERRFTLVFLDITDQANASTQSEADFRLHWQVINIHDAMLHTGETIVQYQGAIVPPDSPFRLYLYLLLEQNQGNALTAAQVEGFVASDCPQILTGRCKFDLQRFIADLHLKPVGASWFRAYPDAWSRMENYHTFKLAPKARACVGVDNFADPCPRETTCPTGVASLPTAAGTLVAFSLLAIFRLY
nr:hypothetical protein BaRGS_012740 [Batillaria attramentaria]